MLLFSVPLSVRPTEEIELAFRTEATDDLSYRAFSGDSDTVV